MARKKGNEESIKTDGWMSTFSDLMNLLLCFFVVLFAMSTVDADKWQELGASFSSKSNVIEGKGSGIGEGKLIASGTSQLTDISNYYAQQGLNQEGSKNDVQDALIKLEEAQNRESEKMGEIINGMLEGTGLNDAVEVQVT